MSSLFAGLFKGRQDGLPGPVKAHLTLKKRLDLRRPVQNADFVAFDTELTGLDFKKDSIISIGAVKLKGSRIFPGRSFATLVRPESPLQGKSVVVHEITHADLTGAAALEDALVDFIAFIGDAVLIGHFVFIDLNFINRAMKRLFGFKLQNPALDTSTLHDWLYENDSAFAKHHKGMTLKQDLYSLAQKYGITVEAAHDAQYDAYLTAQLFQRFLHFLPGCGIQATEELLMIGKS